MATVEGVYSYDIDWYGCAKVDFTSFTKHKDIIINRLDLLSCDYD